MKLLNFLFPKICVGCGKFGSYICEACLSKVEYFETQVCSTCYKSSITGATHLNCRKQNSLDGIISLVNYKNPVRELVTQLKYKFTTDLLTEIESKIKFDSRLIKDKSWTLIPLPLHSTRQNFRGFNQSELLGKIVADKFKLNIDNKILARTKKTTPQVGLSKVARQENLTTAFEVSNELLSENYFIFDDVWTSGASLKSAAHELKKAGAKMVWGLTLAHPR